MNRAFIKTGIFFFIPIVLLLGFPLMILKLSGELTPLERITNTQKDSKILILSGKQYFPDTEQPEDGPIRINIMKPDILVLGSSRVLQIRNFFFKNTAAFYNGGQAPYNHIFKLNKTLEKIVAHHTPRIVIIGLDHDQFFTSAPTDGGEKSKKFHKKSS